jgi:hypothetical protein
MEFPKCTFGVGWLNIPVLICVNLCRVTRAFDSAREAATESVASKQRLHLLAIWYKSGCAVLKATIGCNPRRVGVWKLRVRRRVRGPVRALQRPRSVLRSNSGFCGALLWACGALNRPKRRLPAPGQVQLGRRGVGGRLPGRAERLLRVRCPRAPGRRFPPLCAFN